VPEEVRPAVTVVDPRGVPVVPVTPPSREPHPWSGRTKAMFVGLVLLVVVVAVVSHQVQARHRERLAAETASLRVTVVSVGFSETSRPTSDPVQEAPVTVELRSTVPVTVMSAGLDGLAPLRQDRSDTVLVRWRIRCAEVGEVLGPVALDLQVRGPVGEHPLRIPLAPWRSVFHASAVAVCEGNVR
jgi:hypothetical protein